ncbi:MAG: bacillithiol biosynthesis deacetylase BshB1 [Acidobacteriota bacterium]
MLDVLAIGAHPDDVELTCGGTVAKLVAQGKKVGILHLTRGEMGTRGTPAERAREAERAAEILGAASLTILDCGDGGLRTGAAEQDAVIGVLRKKRPELVLAPPPNDRHPDHERAHRLVRECVFYAGLVRRGEGRPHRPGALLCYMQHDLFSPSVVVDVTSVWQTKLDALAAYHSQIHQPDDPTARNEPMTKVASADFHAAVEGRARHFGQLINVTFGEPFWSPRPLAVENLLDLVPGGLR